MLREPFDTVLLTLLLVIKKLFVRLSLSGSGSMQVYGKTNKKMTVVQQYIMH